MGVVHLPLAPSYAVLCLIQGLLVLAPWAPRRLTRGPGGVARVALIAVPAAMLVAGVVIVRAAEGGARAVTALATISAPLLAAAAGWAMGWARAAWAGPPVAAVLFVVAWRAAGLVADAASVALIALACLTLAGLIALFLPRGARAVGLVALVVVDIVLVFGFHEVQPVSAALHITAPPSLPSVGPPLPALQDATFGGALMGWLDFVAPALLATVMAGPWRPRLVAAAVTLVAALLWGLLLRRIDTLPATVPVLAGLATGLAMRPLIRRRGRDAAPGVCGA